MKIKLVTTYGMLYKETKLHTLSTEDLEYLYHMHIQTYVLSHTIQ